MLSFLVGSLLRIERCKLQLHKSQSSWGYREPAGSLILALMALTSCDHELLPMHFSYQLATFQALALGERKIILWLCTLELVMGMELIMGMHSLNFSVYQ
ncbi:hypothetical protein P8452_76055 [Trifolium repens]|nr:hypothetical protein P8452_76055 [Trifolium repens]